MSVLRLHDDDATQTPSWRDCHYPPYEPEGMARMDKVIELAHRNGMKVVPYFSLKEFHPDCPEYPQNADNWKRWSHPDGRINDEKGPYGGYMCMRSPWLGHRKRTIDQALRQHAFDGVYYDHLWFRYCRHPGHAGGHWHTDAEEILEFLFWTRERVGQDGFIFLHTSGCPTMIGENLSDLIFIGEDMNFARPLPGTHPPDQDFVPITPRNWVPAGRHWSQESADFKQSALIQFLEHCPSCGSSLNGGDSFTLGLSALHRDRLAGLDFLLAHDRPVDTSNPEVLANVYFNADEMLILCANLSSGVQACALRPDFGKIGWGGNISIQIEADGRKTVMTSKDFSERGLPVVCPPEAVAIYKVTKFRA